MHCSFGSVSAFGSKFLLILTVLVFQTSASAIPQSYDINQNAAPGAKVHTGFVPYSQTPVGNRQHHYFPTMNDNGDVAGRIPYTYQTSYGSRAGYKATLWQSGVSIDLGVMSCRLTSSFAECSSNALAINSNAQVWGTSNSDNNVWLFAQPPSVYDRHEVKFNGDGTSNFVQGNGWEFGWISDVNSVGDLVGTGRSTYQYEGRWGDYETHGYVVKANGSFAEIGLYNNPSFANAINAGGQVTGTAYFPDSQVYEAYVWTSAQHHQTPTRIMTSGTLSEGFDINTSGVIVGSMEVGSADHAFMWNGTSVIDLGTLGGVDSVARSVNDAGDIVGYSQIAGGAKRAFIYQAGVMYDLNDYVSLPTGWLLVDAYKVNQSGQVLVRAQRNGSTAAADNAYWILTPVASGGQEQQFTIIEDAAEGAWVTTVYTHGQGQTLYGSPPDPYGYYTTDFPKMNDFNEVAARVRNDLASYPLTQGNAGEAAIWSGENRKDGSGTRVMEALGVVYCRDVNNDGLADNSMCGSRALDINNDGLVVGSSHDWGLFGSYPEKSYYKDQGQWYRDAFGYFSGQSYIVDVNENGDRVGSGIHNLDYLAHGAINLDGQPSNYIGELDQQTSYAHAINNNGDVTGQASFSGAHQAFLWQSDGTATGILNSIGTLGGDFSVGYDINDSNVIVGYAANASGDSHAFSWDTTSGMIDLGTLGGSASIARSVNNAGQIVGYAVTTEGDPHAFIYENGQMHDLNNRVVDSNGWELIDAYHINEFGEVLVRGKRGNENEYLILTYSGIVKCRDCDATDDSDQDGVSNPSDAFPYNANETADSDNDGYGDNRDVFPNDSSQWDNTATEMLFSYARTFGNRHGLTLNADVVTDVYVDNAGNVYQTGTFRKEADLSGVGVNSASSGKWNDAFVTKTRADGTFDWQWQGTGFNQAIANRVVTDATGNVYVVGQYKYSTEFSGVTLSGVGWTTFVAKLSSSGEPLWIHTLDGDNHEYGQAIAIDSTGNIYVAGYFDSPVVDFDPSAALDEKYRVGYSDLYVTKLTGNGDYAWTYHVGGASSWMNVSDIVVDGSGAIYVSGRFTGSVDFDAGAGNASHSTVINDYDGFVLKLSSTASYSWVWVNSGSGDSNAGRLFAQSAGVSLAGAFSGSADLNPLGGGYVVNGSDSNGYVVSLDSTGTASLFQTISGSVNDVAVDSTGNRYIAGQFSGQGVDLDLSAGVDSYTSAGEGDVFISKYSSGLLYQWSKQLGGAGADNVSAIHLMSDDDLYLTGSFASSVDMDPDQGENVRESQGHEDGYLLLLSNTPQVLRDSDNDGLSDQVEEALGLNKFDSTDATSDTDGDGLISHYEHRIGLNPVDADSDGDGMDDKFELDTYGLNPLSAADAIADNDLDGVSNIDEYLAGTDPNVAGIGNYAWVHTMGTPYSNSEKAHDVHVDAQGNIFQVGEFYGPMDFSAGLGIAVEGSTSYRYGFVVKTAADGSHDWHWIMETSSLSRIYAVTTDVEGNVYVAGEFYGTDRFSGESYYASNYEAAIVKLSADGEFVWLRVLEGSSSDYPTALTTDSVGNVYMAGYFYSSTLDVDPGAGTVLLTRQGSYDAFVLSLNSNGDYLWSHQMGGTGGSIKPTSIVLDGQAAAYVGGEFKNSVDFNVGGTAVTKTSVGSNSDAFVVALDQSGSYNWLWAIGDTRTDRVEDLAYNGSVITAVGRFGGTVDFDPDGGGNVLVAPYSSYSNFLVDFSLTGSVNDPRLLPSGFGLYARTIDYDNANSLYIGGSFYYTTDFNLGPVEDSHPGNGTQAYVTKYYSDGFYAWTQSFGGSGTDSISDISVTPAGDLYASGYFYSTTDFNPGVGVDERTSIYADDLFLVAFASNPEAVRDSDGDRLADVIEVQLGLDPNDGTDSAADSDGDGLINHQEYKLGTEVFSNDSDGDGIDDGYEYGDSNLDPLDPSDSSLDFDRDGLTNYDEYLRGTDMYSGDTDNFEWVMTSGSPETSTNYESTLDIATDSVGNVYEAGLYQYSNPLVVENSQGDITLDGSSGGFLIKRNMNGDVVWTATTGSSSRRVDRVAVDGAGNVYTAMWHNNRYSSRGIYVAKYDVNGNPLWQVKLNMPLNIGYNYQGSASDIVVDHLGNIYISGSDYGRDDAVVKLASDGTEIWSRSYPFSVLHVAVDEQGNLYTGGTYSGTQNFDPYGTGDVKTAVSGGEVFVSRFLADGTYQWTWSMGNGLSSSETLIRLEGLINGVRAFGAFNSTADFDTLGAGHSVTAPRSNAGYLARLGASGGLVDMNAYNFGSPIGFSIDGDGNTYMASSRTLVKYFADGETAWSQLYSSSITLKNMETGSNDNLFLSGRYASSNGTAVDFDPSIRVAKKYSVENSNDMFVIKLNRGDASQMVDSDHDGISDIRETAAGLDYLNAADATLDFDLDGLSNYQEVSIYGTNISAGDTDGDGLTDGLEVQYANSGFDPLDGSDGAADYDGDGISNADEINTGGDFMLAEEDANGWYRVLYGSGDNEAKALAVDSLGNQIISVTGNADIDPSFNEAVYSNSLGKISPEGNLLWATTDVYGTVQKIVVDSADNIYVGSTGSPYQIVVTKYDSSGSRLWRNSYGYNWWSGNFNISGLLLDNSENVIVHGFYMKSLSFHGNSVPTPKGRHLYMLRLDSAGGYIQHWTSGSTAVNGYAYPGNVVIDSANNLYLGGFFKGEIDFDPADVTGAEIYNRATESLFLLKMTLAVDGGGSPVLNHAWTQVVDDTGSHSYQYTAYNTRYSLALNESANKLYVSGYYQNSIDFAPGVSGGELTPSGIDIFIAEYDTSGSFLSALSMGGSGSDYGATLKLDGAGDLYVLGRIDSNGTNIDLDPTAGVDLHTGFGGYDISLTKLSGGLVYQWSQVLGGTNADYGHDLTLDGAGNLYLQGVFDTNADLDVAANRGNVISNGKTAFYRMYKATAL